MKTGGIIALLTLLSIAAIGLAKSFWNNIAITVTKISNIKFNTDFISFNVTFQINNSSKIPITIEKIKTTVFKDKNEIGTVEEKTTQKIPANGTSFITLDAVIPYNEIIFAATNFPLSVKGEISIKNIPFKIPFVFSM